MRKQAKVILSIELTLKLRETYEFIDSEIEVSKVVYAGSVGGTVYRGYSVGYSVGVHFRGYSME